MNPKVWGVFASAVLFAVYFGIVTAAQGVSHAIEQFLSLWYLMVPLIAGFGVQMALFVTIRQRVKCKEAAAGAGAAGGMSGGSMVACCAHHVSDVLPFIGLSGAALVLAQYQGFFLIIGILSNVIGILTMVSVMQKNHLTTFKYDLAAVRNNFFVVALVIGFIAFMINSSPATAGQGSLASLSELTDSQDSISYIVKPVSVGKDSVSFSISMDTHSGSLDIDLLQAAILKDNEGSTYSPVLWQGSPPGGHHRSGTLSFSGLRNSAKSIQLSIDHPGSPRSFRWNL